MNVIELFHGVAGAPATMYSNRAIPAKAPIFKKNAPFQDFPRRQHHFPLAIFSTSVGNTNTVSKITCLKMDKSAGGLTYKDASVDIDVGSVLVRRIEKIAPALEGLEAFFL